MTGTTRKPGEFCWINILSPKPEKAMAFYAKVLGWEFTEMPGMGHGIKVGGSNIGGLFNTVSPQTPDGTAPVMATMIKVESADATAAKIKSLGGKAMDAFDVGPAGRMAVCHDPNGAKFDIWQAKAMQGTDVDPNVPGAPSWWETVTSDTAKAGKFYESLFGWKPEVSDGMGFPYTTYKLGGKPVAGMMPLSKEMVAEGMKPDWAIYFTVNDVDETSAVALAAGAKTSIPPSDIPDVGRFGGLVSPDGVMFYVIKHLRPQP